MQITVFVTFNINTLELGLGQAVLDNDVAKVRQINQTLVNAAQTLRSWANGKSGSVVDENQGEVTVQIPATGLVDIEQVSETYRLGVGVDTVWVGVGKKLMESGKACDLARKLKLKKIVYYDKSVEEKWREIHEAESEAKDETETLAKASIKGFEAKAGTEKGVKTSIPIMGLNDYRYMEQAMLHPKLNVVEHFDRKTQSLADPNHFNKPVKVKHPMEISFRKLADIQDQKDKIIQAQKNQEFQQIKEQTAVALQNLRDQLPVLQQFKTVYPDVYGSILTLIQNIATLARELQTSDGLMTQAVGQNPLDKASMSEHRSAHTGMKLPVGTIDNGKMKIKGASGHNSWISLRNGAVASDEAVIQPVIGENSNPTSKK